MCVCVLKTSHDGRYKARSRVQGPVGEKSGKSRLGEKEERGGNTLMTGKESCDVLQPYGTVTALDFRNTPPPPLLSV